MKKIKVTLSINPILLKHARMNKVNLSQLLENAIFYYDELELRTIVIKKEFEY